MAYGDGSDEVAGRRLAVVAAVGAVFLLLALCTPIRLSQPGDHERVDCGNTLWLDLRRWPDNPRTGVDDDVRAQCRSQRGSRLAIAGGVVVATVVAMVIVLRRRSPRPAPRPGSPTDPPGRSRRR